jgi:hypothetical protein
MLEVISSLGIAVRTDLTASRVVNEGDRLQAVIFKTHPDPSKENGKPAHEVLRFAFLSQKDGNIINYRRNKLHVGYLFVVPPIRMWILMLFTPSMTVALCMTEDWLLITITGHMIIPCIICKESVDLLTDFLSLTPLDMLLVLSPSLQGSIVQRQVLKTTIPEK